MNIDKRILPILKELHFPEFYKGIVDSSGSIMEHYIVSELESTFKQLGYEAQYLKSENFFKLLLSEESVEIQLNFAIKYGALELILGVIVNSERYKVGGPFGYIYRSLTGERLTLPHISSYNHLEEMIKKTISFGEDLKSKLLQQSKS